MGRRVEKVRQQPHQRNQPLVNLKLIFHKKMPPLTFYEEVSEASANVNWFHYALLAGLIVALFFLYKIYFSKPGDRKQTAAEERAQDALDAKQRLSSRTSGSDRNSSSMGRATQGAEGGSRRTFGAKTERASAMNAKLKKLQQM